MAIKVGISGFGRIGRVVIRAAMDFDNIEICGINVRNADLDYMVYMLRYDSVFGRFPKSLGTYEKGLLINGKKVPVYSESEPQNIPWKECGAEYVVESTGAFVTTELAKKHIEAGAKKVVISAPAKDDTPTFVMGVNHEDYKKEMEVVSNASCTTNCLAPLVKVLEDNWGVEQGLMSTIHAATSKQHVVDARSMKDWRAGRATFGNIIPTSTGAAKAVGLVIPSVQGKLTGISYRVPVADVSLVDLNVQLKKPATYEAICEKIKDASETHMKGIIEYVDDEVVSSDFIGDPCTSIFDVRQGIMLNEKFVKLVAFYDNEFGYSAKILMLIEHMASADAK